MVNPEFSWGEPAHIVDFIWLELTLSFCLVLRLAVIAVSTLVVVRCNSWDVHRGLVINYLISVLNFHQVHLLLVDHLVLMGFLKHLKNLVLFLIILLWIVLARRTFIFIFASILFLFLIGLGFENLVLFNRLLDFLMILILFQLIYLWLLFSQYLI